MPKLVNKNVCDEEEVWDVLGKSEKFGWSLCKDKAEPFRHTAIVLYFDKVPRFTINFRIEDGTSKVAAAFGEAKPLITIEFVADTNYEYFDPIEEFPVSTANEKQRAKERILSIISFNPGKYNLFLNNCRDHVQGVVSNNPGKEIPLQEFKEAMEQTQTEDIMKMSLAVAATVSVTGVVAWAISKICGGKKSEK